MNAPPAAYDYRSFLSSFWRLMTPYKPQMRTLLWWILASQVCALFEPFVVKFVIDDILERGVAGKARLPWLSVGAFIAFVVISLVIVPKNRRIRRLWQSIECDMPLACGKKLLALPLVYHQREHSETLVGKIIKGVGRVMDIIGTMSFEIVPLIIQTVVSAGIMMVFEWRATVVLLVLVSIFVFLTAHVKYRMTSIRRKRSDLDNEADTELGQAITNVMTVQAYGQEERELASVAAKRREVLRLEQVEYAANEQTDLYRNALVSLGRASIIALCAYSVYDGRISLGTLAFVITLAERVFANCYRINGIFDRVSEAMEPVKRITDLMAEEVTIADPVSPVEVPERFKGEVVFNKLTYSYPVRHADGAPQRPALTGLDHTIAAGDMVGIPGPSGGGKSTLVRLLMRSDAPDQGSITIDGIKLCDMRLQEFRRQIGYVPQEVEIFDRTIAMNIAFGRSDATREEVIRAAKIANAHDFIMQLERGYDTVVGNRGLRLSGGQRQRIGIARAVILDPPILIFDEATSHVDVVSEQKIQRAIDTLRVGRTIILIAHRLSTIQNADHIMVVEDGRIKETGTHSQLLKRNGM